MNAAAAAAAGGGGGADADDEDAGVDFAVAALVLAAADGVARLPSLPDFDQPAR